MSATREITPSASRLTHSLRDIGYDFETALADLVDNSIAAGATEVDIRVTFDGAASSVTIADNGCGMTERQLDEALRFGSRRVYGDRDLGKFGLGLKTASLSQARRLTVVSRPAEKRIVKGLTLDLDHVEKHDRWEVLVRRGSDLRPGHIALLGPASGTVVIWEGLDRVLTYTNPDGEWARRKLQQLADSAAEYLAMVFHRFIEGTAGTAAKLKLTINRDVSDSSNGDVLQAWDPYVSGEPAVRCLGARRYPVAATGATGTVTITPYVLPAKEAFTTPAAFERAGGPLKWNRQQGLYIYRSGRLIQAGGWAGMRTLDEHMKLARVSVEFDPCLDPLFQVNVAKMRVTLPPELKSQIRPQISEVCHEADRCYRAASADRAGGGSERPTTSGRAGADVLFGLRATALGLGAEEFRVFERVVQAMRSSEPDALPA